MLKYFIRSLLVVLPVVIEAQDEQAGFISIDCGLQGSNYTDSRTGLLYTSDSDFIDSGVSKFVSTDFNSTEFVSTNSDIDEQFKTLRYFPQGLRNCYTLKPDQGKGGKYLIRARFMYGNYDGFDQPPKFDLHIGNQYWDTVGIYNSTRLHMREIIHSPSQDYIHVCLIKTGPGIPFISILELRPIEHEMYPTKEKNVSLNFVARANCNPTENALVRFKDDIYDRIWAPFPLSNSKTLNSTSFRENDKDIFKLPSTVMSTAAEAVNTSGHLLFYWDAKLELKYYLYLHFAELKELKAGQKRLIDIYVNENYEFGNYIPPYLSPGTVYAISPSTGNETYIVDIAPNPGTTLPPIINALEICSLVEFPLLETFDGDVAAMVSIKSTYKLTENWQGDPCGPQGFQWDGVNCTNNDGLNNPKIISLNMSSKRLVGSIAPAIFELKALTTLDLSENNLIGVLPESFAKLDSLTVLNLKGNDFSGSCPQILLDKVNTGKLNIISDSICGGVHGDGGVGGVEKKKKSNIVVIIGAVAAGGFFLIFASFFAFYIMKAHKKRVMLAKVDTIANKRFGIVNKHNNSSPIYEEDSATFETTKASSSQNENPILVVANKSRKFTYLEILEVTNNFEVVIGKGGFGTVYHGYVGDTEVAVKMLSPTSSQGYKEFQAEASLLLTIHHTNLTSLVGYCYEGTNMAIVYHYMPNGNMEKHLFGNGPNVLTWEVRLKMAIDAAQGLEYLHHGCKPPIVHRDIKTTNILVDGNFQVKLADFGLSRAFPVEDATHITTVVAGTPGYLDPEYYVTTRLTEKSDVYSFGIVLLEVVTGRPAVPQNSELPHVITWVSSELEKGDLNNIVDPKLQGNYNINSIWKVLEVAISCVARQSVRRPTMKFVVIELNACLEMKMSSNETESNDSIGFVSLSMENGLNPDAR